jgi:adenylate cyclase
VARLLDWVSVKGKTAVTPVYELLGLRGEVSAADEALAAAYAQGLAKYRERDWQAALELFLQAERLREGDVASARLIARCRAYQMNPPGENWDGAQRLSEK